jgi:hypothetical protein
MVKSKHLHTLSRLHFGVGLPSTFMFPKCNLYLGVCTYYSQVYREFVHIIHKFTMFCLINFDLITLIILRRQNIMKLLILEFFPILQLLPGSSSSSHSPLSSHISPHYITPAIKQCRYSDNPHSRSRRGVACSQRHITVEIWVTWSNNIIHWSVILWSARKSDWFAFSKFLSSACFWSVPKISFSNNLPEADKILTRCKFGGNF